MSEEKYNKELIRNRMLKFAGAFWGIRKSENLDPAVKLLIESLSNEMYKLHEEFCGIETRLLEKTARMLTPGMLVYPSPAHAVVHASPIEVESTLRKDMGMYYENRAVDKHSKLSSLYFYPSCNTIVRDGDIKYMFCDDLLYEIDCDLNKRMIARTERKVNEPSCVWVGLRLNEQIHDLRGMSFYLDFPNITDCYEYLYLLSCTEWSLCGRDIVMKRGIYEMNDQNMNEAMSFFADYEIANVIDNHITGLYKNHYLTVTSSVPIEEKDKDVLPGFFKDCLPEGIAQGMKMPLLWLKIKFPSNFKEDILEDLQAGINIVPVENKKLYGRDADVKETYGLIPLVADDNEHLLSVYSVRDEKGEEFHELSYNKSQEGSYATYSIRRGGCERFDSRSAKDLLTYLMDLLSDETSAFGSLSSTKLRSLVQQMNLLITQMKQATENIQEYREMPYYVLVDQVKGREKLNVRYWVTNCEAANGLKAGAELVPNANSFLKPKELLLVSSTYGGKREPRFDERLNLYKYELTTRDRILTNDDIASFCKKELGDLLRLVEIKNGVAISAIPKEGLIRTKDIYLTLSRESKDRSQEEQIKRDLKTRLMEKSPDTFNYRLFIH